MTSLNAAKFSLIIDPLSKLVPDTNRPVQRGYLHIEHPNNFRRKLVVVQQKPAGERLDTIFRYIQERITPHQSIDGVPSSEMIPTYNRQLNQIRGKTAHLYNHYNHKRPWYLWILSFFFSSFSRVDDSYKNLKNTIERSQTNFSATQAQPSTNSGELKSYKPNNTQRSESHIHTLQNTGKEPQDNDYSAFGKMIFQAMSNPQKSKSEENLPFTAIAPSNRHEPIKPTVQFTDQPLSIQIIPAHKMGNIPMPASIRNRKLLLNYTGEMILQLKDLTTDSIPLLHSLFDSKKTKAKQLTIEATGKEPITPEQGTFLTHLFQSFYTKKQKLLFKTGENTTQEFRDSLSQINLQGTRGVYITASDDNKEFFNHTLNRNLKPNKKGTNHNVTVLKSVQPNAS